MQARAAWRSLGIAPTTDKRAIKRAYAARLKAIDPDKDVSGFQTLREALAGAEAAAERLAAREASEASGESPPVDGAELSVDEGLDGCVSNDLSHSGIFEPGLDVAERVERPVADQPADPRIAVESALFPGTDRPVDPQRLREAVQALLADERMEQVDFAAETEEWLAFILAQGVPASDPVIPMVFEHFGWIRELSSAKRRGAIAFVAERADDLKCIASLRNPTHRWYEAFAVLQRPAPKALLLDHRIRLKTPIAQLLASIRYHHPAVEGMLDASHVAMWDQRAPVKDDLTPPPTAGGISWYGWLWLAWVAILLIRWIARAAG